MEMNQSNPYETPESNPESRSLTVLDILAVGIWLVNLGLVIIGRSVLLDFFEEFGIEVPLAARYLMSFYSPFLFAVLVAATVLVVVLAPQGAFRRLLVLFASLSGVVVTALTLVSVISPLLALIRALG